MKSVFLDKLIDRMDRVDPDSLQTQFLRLAEERGLLETIFRSIQEGILVLDEQQRLTYANRSAEGLLGFDGKAALGRPVVRHIREIDWERILDEASLSGLITREIEITYPEHRFVSFYVVPLEGEGPEKRGVVIILRNVTQDRLKEASNLQSERLDAVKLLAAGVAHEIGNPLNALNIHLQLLDREIGALDRGEGSEPFPEAVASIKELVEIAGNEVSRLDLIITQFLKAIRPSAPEFVSARIDTVLTESLRLLRNEVENRNIHIEIVVPDALPEIRIDRNQIKQAFFNLIRNAFQAMPDEGTLQIRVSTSDTHMHIAFEDTGVGIEKEDFGRIFEPYQTNKPSGTGLGLMIVQRIVQEHGGEIEVRSTPREGTTFTVSLPLVERRVRLLNTGQGADQATDREEMGTDQ